MKKAINRSVEILREEGLRSFWFKLLGETVYRRVDIAILDARVIPPDIELAAGLEIGLLQSGGIAEFLDFRPFNDHETVVRRLELGHFCVLVRERGEIVHSSWVAARRATIDYLDCDLELADDVAYVYEAYTLPACRGRGIAAMRSPALSRYCIERGRKRRLAVVWPESYPARRSIEKSGASFVGRLGYFGLGRSKRYFVRYSGGDIPFRLVENGARAA